MVAIRMLIRGGLVNGGKVFGGSACLSPTMQGAFDANLRHVICALKRCKATETKPGSHALWEGCSG